VSILAWWLLWFIGAADIASALLPPHRHPIGDAFVFATGIWLIGYALRDLK
jgi:hypothetical protein